MNIQLEFIGFPLIYDLFPQGFHRYRFPGGGLVQLMEDLISLNESRIREALMDPDTKSLDPTIQIMINGKLIPKETISGQKVEEGDQVTFMKLLAGG